MRWKKRESMCRQAQPVHPIIRPSAVCLRGSEHGREYLDATLRFSMSEFTTKEEIDYTLETLYNCIPDASEIYTTLNDNMTVRYGAKKEKKMDISFIFDKIRRNRDQGKEPIYV